eukprot:6878206-Prymnesium_polylepis.1
MARNVFRASESPVQTLLPQRAYVWALFFASTSSATKAHVVAAGHASCSSFRTDLASEPCERRQSCRQTILQWA